MALARIFSCSPEEASTLIHDLERQGYRVEVLRPEETPDGPADLEIQYELCENSRVVERAQELASELKADIAVATGAFASVSVEPVPEIVSMADSKENSETTITPELETASMMMDKEDSNLEEVAANQVPAPMEMGEPQNQASPGMWSRATVVLIARTGNLLQDLRSLWLAAADRMREQRQQVAIHAAEASARRRQKLLELTCRRAEALQRSRQIEAARRAASGYLSQLEREPGIPPEQTVVESGTTSQNEKKSKAVAWLRTQHMKSIAAGAAAAGALFALTLGISALRSRPTASPAKVTPPLASPQITVESSSVISQAAAHPAAPAPNASQATAKRARVATPAQAQEDDDVADDVVVRHFSHTRPEQISHTRPAQKLQSRSEAVKRYSDLDN